MRIENRSLHLDMSEQSDREVIRVFEYGLDVLPHLGMAMLSGTALSTEGFVRGTNEAVADGANYKIAFDLKAKPTLLRALIAALENPDLDGLPNGTIDDRQINIGAGQFVLPALQAWRNTPAKPC